MKEDDIITLRIKRETAMELETYAQELGGEQSEVLQHMLDFFRANPSSPLKAGDLTSMERRITFRIEYLIRIVRRIEKDQIKPTYAILQLLFQEKLASRKAILVEKKQQTSGDQ